MKISKIVIALVLLAGVPAFAQVTSFTYQKALADPGINKWVVSSVGWQNIAPSGTWWRNQMYITQLSLTTDQQKKMDDVFQQARIKLIDLTASLDKEEAIMEPLIKAERLDEAKVATQIDRIANARAELEKANARMLLGIRQVLTPEQWTKLNTSKLGAYADSVTSGYTYRKILPK